jgi:hypothetical protein
VETGFGEIPLGYSAKTFYERKRAEGMRFTVGVMDQPSGLYFAAGQGALQAPFTRTLRIVRRHATVPGGVVEAEPGGTGSRSRRPDWAT